MTPKTLTTIFLLNVVIFSATNLSAQDRILKSNYQIEYLNTPKSVATLGEMISQGELYGRFRSNIFYWDWENENPPKTYDNNAWGMGGSLIYKSGFLNGFGATVGFYGTIPLLDDNTHGNNGINYAKAGKDTFRTRDNGSEAPIGVFAEGYIEYKSGKNDLKVGRQIIETTLLASNDGKMIPNTFEAAVFESKMIFDTTTKIGYIASQKLRDHQDFHSIIAFEKYNENDDNGANKGLTPDLIGQYGAKVNPAMIILAIANKTIPCLTINADYYMIDGFFSTSVAELNYQFDLLGGWKITPGARYLYQHDSGSGVIGGAALTGVFKDNYNSSDSRGYTDPNSVDGMMWAGRIVAKKGALTLMGGYSDVSNRADIIAPWRGFPTGGYTRSMAQLNWIANTKSWMIKCDYDLDKEQIIPGMQVSIDYVDMDFDDTKFEAKSSIYNDRNAFHIDIIQAVSSFPNTELRFRFSSINAKSIPTIVSQNHDYESYNDFRLELNYLF